MQRGHSQPRQRSTSSSSNGSNHQPATNPAVRIPGQAMHLPSSTQTESRSSRAGLSLAGGTLASEALTSRNEALDQRERGPGLHCYVRLSPGVCGHDRPAVPNTPPSSGQLSACVRCAPGRGSPPSVRNGRREHPPPRLLPERRVQAGMPGSVGDAFRLVRPGSQTRRKCPP
jgi:hypothetical protein